MKFNCHFQAFTQKTCPQKSHNKIHALKAHANCWSQKFVQPSCIQTLMCTSNFEWLNMFEFWVHSGCALCTQNSNKFNHSKLLMHKSCTQTSCKNICGNVTKRDWVGGSKRTFSEWRNYAMALVGLNNRIIRIYFKVLCLALAVYIFYCATVILNSLMLDSYGVVLWELTTREVPYKGITGPAISFAVLNRTCELTVPNSYPDNIRTVVESKFHLLIEFCHIWHLHICRYLQNSSFVDCCNWEC